MSIPTIYPLSDVGQGDVMKVGGKASGLGELIKAGARVPKGFVVVAGADEQDPTMFEADLFRAFDALGVSFVAVRSSAVAEDAVDASWAGQLETFLHIGREELLGRVQDCWSSVSSPRAKAYAAEHGGSGGIAVVVQQMIFSEVSGIAFSANPVSGDVGQIVIEAGFGLGEAIVSGQITPDTYVVDKATLGSVDKDVANQTKQLCPAEGGGTRWEEITANGNVQKLSDEAIKELAEVVRSVEASTGRAVDVEWARAGGELFLLQSRPITTL